MVFFLCTSSFPKEYYWKKKKIEKLPDTRVTLVTRALLLNVKLPKRKNLIVFSILIASL